MYNRYKDDFYFCYGHRQLGNNCKDSGGHFNPSKVSWPWWQLSIRMLDLFWASCFPFYLQSRFVDCDLCRWPTELQQTRRGILATWATSWSTTLSSPGWRRFDDAGDDEEDWPNQSISFDSIAASLFENNWLSWQIVRRLRQPSQVQNLWGASAH